MLSLDDLGRLDLRKLDLTQLDLTKLDLTKLDPTKLDLTKLDLTQLELPVGRLTGYARDAASVGVGAVVVAVQQAGELRRELTDQVRAGLRTLAAAAR